MKRLVYFCTLIVALGVSAQDKEAVNIAKTIKIADLKNHLSIIASDEYEGRETGKKGQKMAAEYIANYFKKLGLEGPVDGTYLQKFDLYELSVSEAYLRKGSDKKIGPEDFIYYSRAETSGEEEINLIMEGDSVEYKNKYVVVYTDKFLGLQELAQKYTDSGALGVMMVLQNDERYEGFKQGFSSRLKRRRLSFVEQNNNTKLMVVNKDFISWIYDKPSNEINPGDRSTVVLNAKYEAKPIETENVLGYLKGSEKPEELLIITAHYDHIGIKNDLIHNGADDDGSGTVTILELAEAFTLAASEGNRPKRSILFMTVTGEEKGLLGSSQYTDNDPIFPLENTVTNLNIDMIGRIDNAHEENSNYIYLIGSDKLSQDLHDLSEEVNKTYINMELDYTYNDVDDPNRYYYRSDHYNFAKNNIPVIFYFNGTHKDYHRSTDTIDKIDFTLLQKRARLVFHTAWEIANRENRIEVDRERPEAEGN